MILDYPFEGNSPDEIQANIAEGKIKPIPKNCKFDEKFIKIIKEMMKVNPKERINIEKILEESTIKSRIHCYLNQQKMPELEIKKTIIDYEIKEKGKRKTVPFIQGGEIENEKEETEEEKEKKEKEKQERKKRKTQYDLCRHMVTLNKILTMKSE
jgi:DNA-binding Lrp family transcriptional regulator